MRFDKTNFVLNPGALLLKYKGNARSVLKKIKGVCSFMKMAQSGSTAKNVMVALAVGGAAAAVSGAMMMGSNNSLKKAKKNVRRRAPQRL